MKLIKGLAILIAGVLIGLFSAEFIFVGATQRLNEANTEFRSIIATNARYLNENELREQTQRLTDLIALFESYKNGDDLPHFINNHIEDIQQKLKLINPELLKQVSPEAHEEYLQQLSKIQRLKEDVVFYFGVES